jgi:hypothetical protein
MARKSSGVIRRLGSAVDPCRILVVGVLAPDELAGAVAALKAPTLILDGEVCVFDKNLVSQFQLLSAGPIRPSPIAVSYRFSWLLTLTSAV